MTSCVPVTFTIKEGENHLSLVPEGADFSAAGHPPGLYALELRPGTSMEQAKALKAALAAHVVSLSFTGRIS